MKRFLLILLLSLPLAAQQIALPPTSIGLNSPEGQKLLWESKSKADFLDLSMHFETQDARAGCGAASCVMVLNAMRESAPLSTGHDPYRYFDQENFFTSETEKVLPKTTLYKRGATLEQLGGMLAAHGLKVTVKHAADSSVDEFRRVARKALQDEDHWVIINFRRQPLNQEGAGHFCPLGAYHQATDRFLVMDVARFKYPPFWVTAPDLYKAMNTVDSDSGKTRGYLLIGR